MPLCTTTIEPVQSVWGWAFSSDGRPWVAQRVCPIPTGPSMGRSRSMFSRFRILPALRRTWSTPSEMTAIAGRVVAAILEALQPIEDDAGRALVTDVADDPTHGQPPGRGSGASDQSNVRATTGGAYGTGVSARAVAAAQPRTGQFVALMVVGAVTRWPPAARAPPGACRARRAAAQPSLITWWARPTASAPAGTSLVIDRAGADVGVVPDAERRDQARVRAHEGPGADLGAVLAHAVVVAGDRPGADVGALPDGRVPEVADVMGLDAPSDPRLLDLDEVADVGARLDVRCRGGGARRGRARRRPRPPSASTMQYGRKMHVVPDGHVGEVAPGPHDAGLSDRGPALEAGPPGRGRCPDPP